MLSRVFTHPTSVGSGCDFVGPSFFSFDGGALLGHCGRTWLGSVDGGATWSPQALATGGWEYRGPPTVTHDGKAMHSIG